MVGVIRSNRRFPLLLATLFAWILAIPTVYAASFEGVSRAMGTAWNAIGSLFSFEYVSRSPVLREGILKFLIFIMLLRVISKALSGLKKKDSSEGHFDDKTANIIGFVVAAVTVIFTPNVFIFSALILLLVPVALAIWGWTFAVAKGKDNTPPVNPWMGTLVLFMLLLLLQFLQESVYVAGNIALKPMFEFTNTVMDLLILVTIALFVWKLFAAIFTIGKGTTPESYKKTVKDVGAILDTPLTARPPRAPHPKFRLAPGTQNSVELTWDQPATDEPVLRYKIQHRYAKDGDNWKTIANNYPANQPHSLIISALDRTPEGGMDPSGYHTGSEGDPIIVTEPMQFRIYASGRNGFGGWSKPPGYSEIAAPKPAETRPLSESESAEEDRNHAPNPVVEKENEEAKADDAAHTPPVTEPTATTPSEPAHAPELPTSPAGSNPTLTTTPVFSPQEATATGEEVETLIKDAEKTLTESTDLAKKSMQQGITANTPFHDGETDALLAGYKNHLLELTGEISKHNPLDRNASSHLKKAFGDHLSKEDIEAGADYTRSRNQFIKTLEGYLAEAKINDKTKHTIAYGTLLKDMENFLVGLLHIVTQAAAWRAKLPVALQQDERLKKLHTLTDEHIEEFKHQQRLLEELIARFPGIETVSPSDNTGTPSFGPTSHT